MSEGVILTKKFLTKFIEIYKEHPALWKIKSKAYKNKHLKKLGHDALIEYCKTSYPQADRNFICKKIQNIRGCFRKELRKVKSSQRSGAGVNDLYRPNLWYYDLLLFTTDQKVPIRSMESENFEDKSQASDVEDMEETQGFSESSSQEVFKKPSNPNINRKRKYTFQKQQDKFMKTCRTVLQQKETVNEYEAVGINVASKLKKMTATQQILAEGLINKILLKGLFNELTRTTDVTETRQLFQKKFPHDSYNAESSSTSLPLTSPPSTDSESHFKGIGQYYNKLEK